MNQKERKRVAENMARLSEDARAATAMGLTYGKYKALNYSPEQKKEASKPPLPPRMQHHQKLFNLWQEGKSDAEIGEGAGVARSTVQKWRHIMELPPANKCKTNRDEYCLIDTEYGPFVVLKDDLN